MKNYLFAVILTCLLMFPDLANASSPTNTPMESISGKIFVVIQAALPELQKVDLSVVNYKIVVFEKEQSYVVLFDDPDRPPGRFGSTENMLCFEVEVNKSDLRVIRANFVR